MDKPTLPKGTRDFGPAQMARRQFIFNTIREVFQKYGFQPLETPAMENLSTLTGKYGDEGDQLLFKILNSGDFLQGVNSSELESRNSKSVSSQISEKGLRYDLTVPFARYVVMNRHEITFPFKRYQIQPVWRADRPQKGRYREFYQCDADVVGTDSLICETEIILMIKEVFLGLGIQGYTIKINHREILSGITAELNLGGKESDLFTAIDKLEKIGKEKVKQELLTKGFTESNVDAIYDFINPERTLEKKFQDLNSLGQRSPKVQKGLDDISTVFKLLESAGANRDHLDFDISLARGLSYYTGCIFEVRINNVAVGSVSGGGRYDNLTGVFGMDGVSGVGFSFGVDRLYDAMEELHLFPKESQLSSTVLITHMDEESRHYGMKVAHALRQKGTPSEIYPDLAKLKKQLEYADKKTIPWVVVIGSDEIASGLLTLKNMHNGEQQKLSLEQLIVHNFLTPGFN